MALRVCPTCRGMKCVRSGSDVYICPTCKGSGGIPLGDPPTDFSQAEPPSGSSRASDHIARGAPLSRKHMPVEG